MRHLFLLILTITTFISCESTDSDPVSPEEKQILDLLKNEWHATDYNLFYFYNHNDSIRPVDYDLDLYPIQKNEVLKIGMNTRNIFYISNYFQREEENGITRFYPDLVSFGCITINKTHLKGNFLFNLVPFKINLEDFEIKVIDNNTILLGSIVKDKNNSNLYSQSVFKFKRTGSWNENTTYRSIFESFDYPEDWLDIYIGENYEAESDLAPCK